MNEKYWSELRRTLSAHGIQAGPMENNTLLVLLNGATACRVQENGLLCYRQGDLESPEANEIYHRVAPLARTVQEYVSLTERAPRLHSISGNGTYRLLADFNDVILAGKEMPCGGYQFATWDREEVGNAYRQGHYYMNGFEQAKQDFVTRSGLIAKERLFTDEQLVSIYRCVQDALSFNEEITDKQEKMFDGLLAQIKEAVPDIEQQIDTMMETETPASTNQMEPSM